MLNMTIKVHLNQQENDAFQDTQKAINALKRAADKASPLAPALGGTLKNDDGEKIGSYFVEFEK